MITNLTHHAYNCPVYMTNSPISMCTCNTYKNDKVEDIIPKENAEDSPIESTPDLTEEARWEWMINYCKDHELSPEESSSWDIANDAYIIEHSIK